MKECLKCGAELSRLGLAGLRNLKRTASGTLVASRSTKVRGTHSSESSDGPGSSS